MDLQWLSVAKTAEEEKQQFDKLYGMLVQLSKKGSPVAPTVPFAATVPSAAATVTVVDPVKDEFTAVKEDLLANFKALSVGGDLAIPALETCSGCQQSFYSEAERVKHLESAAACAEWCARRLTTEAWMSEPFFARLDRGVATLRKGKTCRFCHKSVATGRTGLEKHFAQSAVCQRLAHIAFREWAVTPVEHKE
jgi:hypothetical protein